MTISNTLIIFGARLLSDVVGGLMLICDNPLDFHAVIVSVSPFCILKTWEIS